MNWLFYLVPAASVLALLFAFIFYRQMKKEDEGTPTMKQIAQFVREGAMAYLKQQYKVVIIVFVVLAVFFAILAYGFGVQNPWVPFAFLTGLVLGWVYFRTGSLLPCILMHLLNNGSSVVLFHLTGQRMDLTMTEQLGPAGALWTAVGGAAVTALCLYLIHRQTAPQGIPPEKEHPKNIQA